MKDSEFKELQSKRCSNCKNYKTCNNFLRGSKLHPECFEPLTNSN